MIRRTAAAVALACPTALAFFTGGYFDQTRAWAGLVAWALAIVAMVTSPRRLRMDTGGKLAIAALAAFAGWSLLSMLWAPLSGNAYHAGQIVFLYLGALIASRFLFCGEDLQRAVEPALAAGVVIVIGYGLSERLLPGLLHFSRSVSAQGRLEQPLTYWNAMGELAALGFVLAARVSADAARPRWLRAAAAAVTPLLGLGVYVSFSRGALFACLAGLVALVVLAPRREALWALLCAVLAGVVASGVAAPSGGVTGLHGSLATREREGAITLAALVVIAAVAAAWRWRAATRERRGPVRLPRHAGWVALVLICAGLAAAIAVGAKEKSGVSIGGGAARLGTLQSNRYDYWKVALRAFGSQPLHGVGAGNWSVWWLRYRTISEFATDTHSLELQTLAELGVVGALVLLAFFTGVGLAARRAMRRAAGLAAGPVAGCIVYLAHSPLDWDWQMPALTLVAIGLAGLLLALAGESAEAEPRGVRLEPAM